MGIALVDDTKDVLLINDSGIVIRLAASEIPILSRVTQGVTLMRTKSGKVVDIAVVDHEEPSDEEELTDEEAFAEGQEIASDNTIQDESVYAEEDDFREE